MISGLPRSGSTLLSSILNQNPRFSAGISNPLYDSIQNSIRAFSNTGQSTQCSEQKRINVLNSMIDGFYLDESAEVVFNASRSWTSILPLMNILRPNAKVICCVRDIGWIIDSFEQLHNKNPTIYSIDMYASLNNKHNTDVYMRADNFMDENGAMYRSFNSLKSAYYSEYNSKLIFIEYDHITTTPEETLRKIYDFIEEPYYNHDFDNVEISYDEYDKAVQVQGLHKVRKRVEYKPRNTIIPPDIWERYKGLEFWRG